MTKNNENVDSAHISEGIDFVKHANKELLFSADAILTDRFVVTAFFFTVCPVKLHYQLGILRFNFTLNHRDGQLAVFLVPVNLVAVVNAMFLQRYFEKEVMQIRQESGGEGLSVRIVTGADG